LSANSILIVDDDVGMLRRLGAAFAVAEYEVHAATDGEIALRRFNAVSPDIVLIDILMPTREGLETIIAMRKERPEAKIIAMSGGGRIGPYEFLNLARHLGADAVIPKPFRLADVLALVAHTLEPAARPRASRAHA
jgi:DNA-binding NtrC family response regulator